jgi:hypothetical protein
MSYIIRKAFRISNTPYAGVTCEKAGVPVGKIYDELEEAFLDAAKLSQANPVGFVVQKIDSDGNILIDHVKPFQLDEHPKREDWVKFQWNQDRDILKSAMNYFRDKRKVGKETDFEFELETKLSQYLSENFKQ